MVRLVDPLLLSAGSLVRRFSSFTQLSTIGYLGGGMGGVLEDVVVSTQTPTFNNLLAIEK
jgi:hypothetical protein